MINPDNNLRWKYDHDNDVLYIMVGPTVETYEEEDPECEGLHIRHALSDNRIVGAIILYFSKQNFDELKRRLPFEFDPAVVQL